MGKTRMIATLMGSLFAVAHAGSAWADPSLAGAASSLIAPELEDEFHLIARLRLSASSIESQLGVDLGFRFALSDTVAVEVDTPFSILSYPWPDTRALSQDNVRLGMVLQYPLRLGTRRLDFGLGFDAYLPTADDRIPQEARPLDAYQPQRLPAGVTSGRARAQLGTWFGQGRLAIEGAAQFGVVSHAYRPIEGRPFLGLAGAGHMSIGLGSRVRIFGEIAVNGLLTELPEGSEGNRVAALREGTGQASTGASVDLGGAWLSALVGYDLVIQRAQFGLGFGVWPNAEGRAKLVGLGAGRDRAFPPGGSDFLDPGAWTRLRMEARFRPGATFDQDSFRIQYEPSLYLEVGPGLLLGATFPFWQNVS